MSKFILRASFSLAISVCFQIWAHAAPELSKADCTIYRAHYVLMSDPGFELTFVDGSPWSVPFPVLEINSSKTKRTYRFFTDQGSGPSAQIIPTINFDKMSPGVKPTPRLYEYSLDRSLSVTSNAYMTGNENAPAYLFFPQLDDVMYYGANLLGIQEGPQTVRELMPQGLFVLDRCVE